MLPISRQAAEYRLRVAVSGSFRRHMNAITAAVHEFASLSVQVLSPADPQVVGQKDGFVFVASDRVRSVRLVQDRHLECIRAADFLWLVCPDGYVGQSASMEVGYAVAGEVPIFSTHVPTDLTLRQYVKHVPSLAESLSIATEYRGLKQSDSILVDPHSSVETAHQILERVREKLTNSRSEGEVARRVARDIAELRHSLTMPACAH